MRFFPSRHVRVLRKHGQRLAGVADDALAAGKLDEEADQKAKAQRRLARLRGYLDQDPRKVDAEKLDHAVRKLEKVLTVNEVWKPKSFSREIGEAFLVAALIAFVVRSFITEPFKIPTGSMIPTLEIDDFIFVTKFAYGVRVPFTRSHLFVHERPDPGDVIVFDFPWPGEDHGKNFIKRVVAGPGDRVRLEDNVLHLNGEPVPTRVTAEGVPCQDGNGGFTSCLCDVQEERLHSVRFVTQHHSPENTSPLCMNADTWPLERPEPRASVYFGDRAHNETWPELTVPDGHYLVMGDNRDNSHDGRYWGLVPFDVVKGRAWIIWWARDKSRVFSAVHGDEHDGDHAHAATKRTNPAR